MSEHPRICFLDLETTGLDPARHDVWEIGLITRGEYVDVEYLWRVEPDLAHADPSGLRKGRFYERTAGHLEPTRERLATNLAEEDEDGDLPRWSNPFTVAALLARLLDGAHIVGAVPSFDAAFLAQWLPKHGQALTAHYHLIDVEALAIGYLRGAADEAPAGAEHRTADLLTPPWNSNDLSRALGVDPAAYERHTALGDARWVRAQYDAVMGGGSDV